MRHVEIGQDVVDATQDVFPGEAQVLQTERDFVLHIRTDNLTFRVLKQRAHALGDLGLRGLGHLVSQHVDRSPTLAPVTVGNEAVDRTGQGAFAAPAHARHQDEFTWSSLQQDIPQGPGAASAVTKEEMFHLERKRALV